MSQEFLNIDEIKEFYNTHDEMWEVNNWYRYTEKQIISYIQNQNFSKKNLILNAGSGGHDYGLNLNMIHVDISEQKLKNIPNSIIGNLEDVDLSCYEFDTIICVGSVLNYCNIYKIINKFSKLLSKNALLVIEFENSGSFEYSCTRHYNKAISPVKTIYLGEEHKINIYSFKLIKNILKSESFEIIESKSFHSFSSLLLRLGLSEDIAGRFCFLDKFLENIPYFRKHSANIIIKCKKQ